MSLCSLEAARRNRDTKIFDLPISQILEPRGPSYLLNLFWATTFQTSAPARSSSRATVSSQLSRDLLNGLGLVGRPLFTFPIVLVGGARATCPARGPCRDPKIKETGRPSSITKIECHVKYDGDYHKKNIQRP